MPRSHEREAFFYETPQVTVATSGALYVTADKLALIALALAVAIIQLLPHR